MKTILAIVVLLLAAYFFAWGGRNGYQWQPGIFVGINFKTGRIESGGILIPVPK